MSDGFKFKGLNDITEIMGTKEEVEELYQSLIRNKIFLPDDLDEEKSWQHICDTILQHEQVLCIVSTRRSCRALHDLMPDGTYHLSALMCGQHRTKIIEEIKRKLSENKPIRVISTQLVEAGVDLDFPVVYRAFAGLDSIAQAAGRCNREGKLKEPGQVHVFIPPIKVPEGMLKKAIEATRNIISESNEIILTNDMFTNFFSELYWKANSLDKLGIVNLLNPLLNDREECSIFFRTVADKIKIIDDEQLKTIFIRYEEGENYIEALIEQGPNRGLMRKLQRYTVMIYLHQFNELRRRGAIEEVYPGMFALSSKMDYSDKIGLLLNESLHDPEKFII